MHERDLISGSDEFNHYPRSNANTYIEIALDYAQAGLYRRMRCTLLRMSPKDDPMLGYFSGWCLLQAGQTEAAQAEFRAAAAVSAGLLLPQPAGKRAGAASRTAPQPRRTRARPITWAISGTPTAAMTKRSRPGNAPPSLDPDFPHRAAQPGPGLFQQTRRPAARPAGLRDGLSTRSHRCARVLRTRPAARESSTTLPPNAWPMLEEHPQLVEQRDDLTIEQITLLNLLGRHRRSAGACCWRAASTPGKAAKARSPASTCPAW